MASKRKTEPENGKPEALSMVLYADPTTDPEAARRVCLNGVAAVVYMTGLAVRVGGKLDGVDLGQTAIAYTDSVIERIAPRDPVEEMLAAQLLATHARAMHLNYTATAQTDLDQLRTVNEYADRASNTYRRLALALAEYRKPPRAGDTFTAIKQANIANQQVVVNGENLNPQNATNEQGCPSHATSPAEPPQAPKALPADPGGARIPESLSGPDAAVGTVHRAEDR